MENLQHGLQRLDHLLLNVTHEQRYLYARTARHLRTAQSTLARTFWYYTAIYGTICLASFSQLVGVRLMFKRVSDEAKIATQHAWKAARKGLQTRALQLPRLTLRRPLWCRVGSRG